MVITCNRKDCSWIRFGVSELHFRHVKLEKLDWYVREEFTKELDMCIDFRRAVCVKDIKLEVM